MIRTHSLLVNLAMFLSTLSCIHLMSTFFSRHGTFLVATESHVPHTTWNGLTTKIPGCALVDKVEFCGIL